MISRDKKVILFVDDTPSNIQVLGKMLGDKGYEISVATSGKQALSIVEKIIPDLILLDVMMPEMDGFTVGKTLKENPLTKDIPILFISAKDDMESKLKGFEIGGADYITKPFQSAEVIARVRTHLELKNALDTVNKYNAQLEQMLEERTKELIKSERHAAFSLLIQGIVHNLKNPLNGVSGGAQMILLNRDILLQEGKMIPEELTGIFKEDWKFAQMIYDSSKNLNKMIDSLMAKSRSDKTDSIEQIDMNNLISQEFNFLLADQKFKHNVKKKVNLSESKLMLEIVPSELSQIFHNLIKNAMDAMYAQQGAELTIESGSENNKVWLSVEDNGPGIPENIRSKIFDPFFTTKTKKPDSDEPIGTGLGLHTLAQMVDSYKGKIILDSKEGVGTKFKIYFPAMNSD